jgi:fumarate hydratase subunit alpha
MRLSGASGLEESPEGRSVFDTIIKNCARPRDEELPICQDTGMAVVFAEVGQEVHISDGSFEGA